MYDPAFHSPAWAQNAVIYQIFPDRFADGEPESNVRSGEFDYGGLKSISKQWGEPQSKWPQAMVEFYGGDLPGVAARFREATQRGPKLADPLKGQGDVLIRQGRRAEALGWGNLLCPSAYVARGAEAAGGATFGEIERLQVRWPDFQERVARFILDDPLRPLRDRLRARGWDLLLERNGGRIRGMAAG